MSERVHIITPSLDHERFSQPLNRDDPPADRAHLIKPPDDHPFPARASEMLAESLEQFEILYDLKIINPTPFSSAVKEVYGLICEELIEGNEIFVNVSGTYHQLSSAAATAASYIVSDSVFTDDIANTPTIEDIRSKIHFYSTEPAGHYFDDIVDAHEEIEAAMQPERVKALQQNANNLAERVKRDRETVRGLNMLLAADLDAAADRFGLNDDTEFAESLDSLKQLVKGINMTVDAMSELRQNQESIEDTFGLFGFDEAVEGVFDLMEQVEQNNGKIEPTDLFDYFEKRLDTINEIVTDAQALEGSPPDSLAQFDEIEKKGIAYGTRTFNEITSPEPPASYTEHPGPLEFNLRQTERALLYTLWDTGSAESVQQFTQHVLRQTLKNFSATGVELPGNVDVEKHAQPSKADEDMTDLASSIQSTVQYNLQKLDEKGFVKRIKGDGRKKTIKLTRAGEIHLQTVEFNEQWLGDAFEDLSESVRKTLKTKL